jgi:alkylhydroperoxidase family enzyme
LTSGARIPKLAPSSLDAEQRSLYDAIAGGRRAQGPQLFRLTDEAGRLEGPFNAFLLQPRLGAALQALGSSVRYDTGLDDRCREIAILTVAAHWHSDFEWYAHEAVARAAGLTTPDLTAIRAPAAAIRAPAAAPARAPAEAAPAPAADLDAPASPGLDAPCVPATLSVLETVVARTTVALLTRGDLTDAEYRTATDHLGPDGLFELLTLVGYYATLALQLRVFRVPAPDVPPSDVPI